MRDKGLEEDTLEFGGKYSGNGEEVKEEDEELNAENVVPAENDRETMLESSSNKRIKEMSMDSLSELPDSLLIHILSFLSVKEASITSVLSKRWRFLWSDLPRLEFWENSRENEKIRRFVSWVHKTLVLRTANYLEKFEVSFNYNESFASDVDGWVEFAVKNKVKEFSLLLNSYEDIYMLPDMIYSNSSLTYLGARGCIMAPQRTIEWQSLTKLGLKEVELDQHVLEEILSCCHVLYSLELDSCWGFNRLEVNSQSLYRLAIEDCEDGDDEPVLEIAAPYIRSLNLSLFPEGRKLLLRITPSLVRANLNFNGYGWDSTSVDVTSNAKELFENTPHVKHLTLGRKCFETVSILVAIGWQLPQSGRAYLRVSSESENKHNISGIIALLESSPNLETLIIEGYETNGELFDLDPAAEEDLDRDLPNLKTVEIENFADPNGEPMLTLARILLKRATALEKMEILIDVEDTDDAIMIGQILLSLPRSSPDAVVAFS